MVTPSSTLETTGPFKGQLVFTDNNEIVIVDLAASTTIIIGQFVTFDSSGNAILATNTTGTQYDGIGIACYNPNSPISTQTATIGPTVNIGDFRVQVAVGNTYAYTLATAAIKFQSLVSVSSGSYAVAVTQPSSVTNSASIVTALNTLGTAAGRYFGHPKEEKTPTVAASSDIIAVRLGL